MISRAGIFGTVVFAATVCGTAALWYWANDVPQSDCSPPALHPPKAARAATPVAPPERENPLAGMKNVSQAYILSMHYNGSLDEQIRRAQRRETMDGATETWYGQREKRLRHFSREPRNGKMQLDSERVEGSPVLGIQEVRERTAQNLPDYFPIEPNTATVTTEKSQIVIEGELQRAWQNPNLTKPRIRVVVRVQNKRIVSETMSLIEDAGKKRREVLLTRTKFQYDNLPTPSDTPSWSVPKFPGEPFNSQPLVDGRRFRLH
jgi:hypothetical protein